MLTYQQCNACGGVYAPIQADGGSYFHACPPVPQFFDDAGLPITRADADGILKLGGKVYRKDVPRANHRDENVVPAKTPKTPPTIKAEGAGAVVFVPPVDALVGAVLIDGGVKLP